MFSVSFSFNSTNSRDHRKALFLHPLVHLSVCWYLLTGVGQSRICGMRCARGRAVLYVGRYYRGGLHGLNLYDIKNPVL